jgi:hypothetical protein
MSAPDRAKVYRNIELRQRWFGLDPVDLFALGGLAWLLNLLSSGTVGWNLLVVAIGAAALRIWKRGKPEGYTTALLRFYLRRSLFSAAARDVQVAVHPFAPTPHGKENP